MEDSLLLKTDIFDSYPLCDWPTPQDSEQLRASQAVSGQGVKTNVGNTAYAYLIWHYGIRE